MRQFRAIVDELHRRSSGFGSAGTLVAAGLLGPPDRLAALTGRSGGMHT